MSEPDVAFYRARLDEMLKRVPNKVNSGGHGTSVAYKNAVQFANKYRAAPRATVMQLREAMNKLRAYED